jgi:hypothetical protein
LHPLKTQKLKQRKSCQEMQPKMHHHGRAEAAKFPDQLTLCTKQVWWGPCLPSRASGGSRARTKQRDKQAHQKCLPRNDCKAQSLNFKAWWLEIKENINNTQVLQEGICGQPAFTKLWLPSKKHRSVMAKQACASNSQVLEILAASHLLVQPWQF